MKTTWTWDEALTLLLNVDGVYKAGVCREDDSWFVRKDLISLRYFILDYTKFLDELSPTFKLRMLCFKLNLKQIPKCLFCNHLPTPIFNLSKFSDICSAKDCKYKKKSYTSKKVYSDLSEDKKKERSRKIGLSNSGSLIERFGEEKSELIKKKISNAGKGRKQSDNQKKKRIDTRLTNNQILNRPWHTQDVKSRISESNSKTHSSPEYRLIQEPKKKLIALKQSKTMKDLIQLGLFTPNSNNWKKSVAIKLELTGENLRFRSRWELAYYLVTLFENNEKLDYETIRIPYVYEGTRKIYIADFYSHKSQTLIEVKPKSRLSDKLELAKIEAARRWSLENKKNFIVIDDDWFNENKFKIQLISEKLPDIKDILKCLI